MADLVGCADVQDADGWQRDAEHAHGLGDPNDCADKSMLEISPCSIFQARAWNTPKASASSAWAVPAARRASRHPV
jgi:hypothetical protein